MCNLMCQILILWRKINNQIINYMKDIDPKIMKIQLVITFIALSVFSTSCTNTKNTETQIAWDSWGVPHITANSIEDLFYAQGWAQMHNHANLILDLYGTSREKALNTGEKVSCKMTYLFILLVLVSWQMYGKLTRIRKL